MQLIRPLRIGLLLQCLLLWLPGCGTLRGLLTPPPAPPLSCPRPTPPPAELFTPVPVPGICYGIQVGEDQQDCTESAIGALAACNAKLAKAGDETKKDNDQ